jgi:hypothetical protein
MAANNYPTVINGGPVDANTWFNPVATDLTSLLPQVGKGRIGGIRETGSNTYTVTELIVTSAQFTAVNGARYRFMYRGPSEGDTAAAGIKSQLRWSHTSTVDLTGTVADSTISYVDTINHTIGNVMLLGDFIATASSTVTVAVSIQRFIGAGNVKANCTVVNGILEIDQV